MADDFRALREHSRVAKKEQRDRRAPQILELRAQGFDVMELTPYQFRVNGCLDIYQTWAKWHDIKRNTRGSFRGRNVKEFIIAYLGAQRR